MPNGSSRPLTATVLRYCVVVVGVASAFVATAYFTRLVGKERAAKDGEVQAASDRKVREHFPSAGLSELERRIAGLEAVARPVQKTEEAPQPSNVVPRAHREPHSREEARLQVAEQLAEMEVRFANQSGRSDWSTLKERELQASLARLNDEQAGRVRSLECREAMCRMEVEYDGPRQAMAFLDEMELRPGIADARSSRIRLKSDEERYVFYIEPRTPSSNVTMR